MELMNKLKYLLPVLLLASCGGTEETSDEQLSAEDTIYTSEHEWILSGNALKEKLASFQASFTDIGNKEVEETICGDESKVAYSGNPDEMNIWLLTTYMLDNFSAEEFGKHNFDMPDVAMKNGTLLSELNWLNFNSSDHRMFSIYRLHPELENIPKIVTQDGMDYSNDENVQKMDMVYKALEDGLLGVLAVTDYLPPTYVSETEFETGYIMGYIMFADWETGELSCISPFLAQNSNEIDFNYSVENNDKYSKEVQAMNVDLQSQTYSVIDSLARKRTGFTGETWVNYSLNLDKYKN